jgi:hypothetical protein
MKPAIYQTDEEDFKCADLNGEGAVIYGTQSYNGESPTSDDVFWHVKDCKEKGKNWWWQCVSVVLVSLKGNSEVICQLQCKCCDTFLSPSNPSNARKTHLKSRICSGYREGVKNGLIPVEEQPAAAEAGPSSSIMQPSSSNKRQALGLSQQRLDDLKAGNQGEVH